MIRQFLTRFDAFAAAPPVLVVLIAAVLLLLLRAFSSIWRGALTKRVAVLLNSAIVAFGVVFLFLVLVRFETLV